MSSCGKITVVSAFDESAVSSSCDIIQERITEGEIAEVEVVVSNGNNSIAIVDVDLIIDGQTIAEASKSVPARESSRELFSVEELGRGTHDVGVDITSVSER